MVVRGDHTCVDFYLTVLPPRTECVVFSIDGSFTASVSIWGKDPKVRAGAIDVVRCVDPPLGVVMEELGVGRECLMYGTMEVSILSRMAT